jgi:hypothetical protein
MTSQIRPGYRDGGKSGRIPSHLPGNPSSGTTREVAMRRIPEDNSLLREKRSINKGHWEWAKKKRRELFEDTVYSIFDQFHMDDAGKLSFTSISLANSTLYPWWSSWSNDFMNDMRDWAFPEYPPAWLDAKRRKTFKVGPRSPKHIRETLTRFLKGGLKKLDTHYPFIAAMPSFREFMWPQAHPKTTKHLSSKKPAGALHRIKKV